MISQLPSDWEFCILPKDHWDEGPTAFINPISEDGGWDQPHCLGREFDAALDTIHAFECMESHVEMTEGRDPEVLRQFLISYGLRENPGLMD